MDQCLIIGEVAQSHDGSLGLAHAFIDAIASAGADAVKFQVHIAAAESTLDEPWRVKFSPQDKKRYDYWKRMEFSEAQWLALKKHAHERGLKFICSPFSLQAVDMLKRVGVDYWKIASGELGSLPLLAGVADTSQPVLVSSGMNPIQEIDQAVAVLGAKKRQLTVMQCTSSYPCPPEKIGLNMIPIFRERYGCFVGVSDHSGKIYPGLAAATIGIHALEVHVTFSRDMFGPDVSSSITMQELTQLAEGIRYIETMSANPIDKDDLAEELSLLRLLFTKSVVACCDLPVGHMLTEKDLALKKPGSGIPGSRLQELIGRLLVRSIKADQMLSHEDLKPA